jgi:hypothetical protein
MDNTCSQVGQQKQNVNVQRSSKYLVYVLVVTDEEITILLVKYYFWGTF